jgi:hypothetical protein
LGFVITILLFLFAIKSRAKMILGTTTVFPLPVPDLINKTFHFSYNLQKSFNFSSSQYNGNLFHILNLSKNYSDFS